MSEDEDFYLPEQIDEQVDALLQSHHLPVQDQRMAHDLHVVLKNADAQEDARSLEHVLQQLLQGERAADRQSGENILSLKLIQRQKQERLARMKEIQVRKFSPIARVFSTLAAVLIVAVLVGSMIIITHAAQQNTGATTATGAAKQPVSQPLGIYTSSSNAVFRLNALTHQAIWQQTLPDVSKIIPTGNVVYLLQSSQHKNAVNDVVELDAGSGKILWKHTFTEQNPNAAAAEATDMVLTQNRLYVSWNTWFNTSYAGSQIYVLNASNGSQISVYPHTLKQILDIDAGDGIFAVGSAGLQVYNATTSKLLWQVSMMGESANATVLSVKIVNNLVYALFTSNRDVSNVSQGYIVAYQATTGKQIWQSPSFSGDALSHFAVNQNIVYFGTLNAAATKKAAATNQPFTGKVYAYNIQSNKRLWSTSVNGGAQEPLAISNGTVYTVADQGGKFDSHLIALNAATGAITWQQPLDTIIPSSFSVSNGMIYVGSNAQYSTFGSGIETFNASTGKMVWKSLNYGYNNFVPTA
jgi:outer membrane protein assembly factor BamB